MPGSMIYYFCKKKLNGRICKMKDRKSCISAIISFLLVLAAIAAVGCVLYKKMMKKKLQAQEDADLLEGDEEADNAEAEDATEDDGEDA